MLSTTHILATAETLLQYREEDFLCDTILVAKDRQLKAHSVLLAAVSPVFRSAFSSGTYPGRIFQVDLPDVESAILETALDYIYTGNLVLPSAKYAAADCLSALFSTLQDLGLDLEKLNGCEMKFKSELPRREPKIVDVVVKPLMGESISSDGSTIFVKHEAVDNDDLEMEENLSASAGSVKTMPVRSLPSVKKASKQLQWSGSTGTDDSEKVSIVAGHLNLTINDNEKAVVVSEDLLNDLVGAHHGFDDVEDGEEDNGEDVERDEDEEDEEGENAEKMDDGAEESEEACILVDMGNGSESRYVVVMPPQNTDQDGATGKANQCVKARGLDARPHVCTTCHRRFMYKYNLLRHEKQHTGVRQHLCHLCGASFIQKTSLDEHVQSKHSDKTNLHNDSADTGSCASPAMLDNPLLDMLTTPTADLNPNRPFLCDICGKNFSTSLSLRMHSKLHTGERPYACTTCAKSFVQKVQLVQHELRHLGVRPFTCDHCDRAFGQKGQLTQHLRQHTGERPFACDNCGASFPAKAQLTQHLRLHTGERPHVCSTCNKDFAYKESLVVHLRTHTGEKPFECQVCGSRYTQSHHLKGHMRTHTGEKPFACHLCDKSYKNRVDLRFHCTRVHNVNISRRAIKIETMLAAVSATADT